MSLWTNCLLSAASGYHAEFHEVVVRRIPISDAGGQCETKHHLSWTRKRVVAAHYKKTICYTVGLAVSYFRLPCGHSRRTRHCRSRAVVLHGLCELTHGVAGERHGRGMLCVNRPLLVNLTRKIAQLAALTVSAPSSLNAAVTFSMSLESPVWARINLVHWSPLLVL